MGFSQNGIELPQEIIRLQQFRKQSLELSDFIKRREANKEFKNYLKELIQSNKKLLRYSDSIPHFGVIESPDKALTIYNWNLIDDFGSFEYFAFIDLGEKGIITPLDLSERMQNPLNKKCKTSEWYGALYYEVIPTKIKKEGTYYVLLGWDGKSPHGTRKVIDVFYYDEELSNWFFGKTIFGPPFRDQTRYFIEYSSEVVVSLKYHKDASKIIFDHVVPPNKGLDGVYDFYAPDLSFDAFEFRKDFWYLVQNVDVRGDQKMDEYVTPKPVNLK